MAKSKPLPPLDALRYRLALRSDGVLIWKRPMSSRAKAGMEAGRWNKGYRYVNVERGAFAVHRIVWALANGRDPAPFEIDHINGQPEDNRPSNLRLCNRQQNLLNTRVRTDNTSGAKGVSYDPSSISKPWRSYYKGHKLGRFGTKEEAIDALIKAVEQSGESDYYRFHFPQ